MKKRFSFKFWLCNLIYRDYLRSYLAIDKICLHDITKYAESHNGNIPHVYIDKLKYIADDIEWLMTGKKETR